MCVYGCVLVTYAINCLKWPLNFVCFFLMPPLAQHKCFSLIEILLFFWLFLFFFSCFGCLYAGQTITHSVWHQFNINLSISAHTHIHIHTETHISFTPLLKVDLHTNNSGIIFFLLCLFFRCSQNISSESWISFDFYF